MHKANDDQVDDHYSDEEAFYSHIESNEPSREDIDLPHGSREDIDLPHGSQESKPNRDHRISLLRRKKRDGLRGSIFSRDEYSRQLPDSSDRQENEIKDPENKVHPLRKEVLECFSNLDEELSCSEVKAVLTISVQKASDNEGDDRSSDEEAFYSQSNQPSREDIDSPHGSQESKPNRDHRSSLPRRQKRDSLRARRDSRDEYSRQLLDSLDRQENEIKDLETEVRSLRKEVRERFSNMDEKLSGFEVKVDLIVNLVSSWFQHPFSDRRCRGFCTKHVRTDKCLCRGLKEPHRCCGHISGLCDC